MEYHSERDLVQNIKTNITALPAIAAAAVSRPMHYLDGYSLSLANYLLTRDVWSSVGLFSLHLVLHTGLEQWHDDQWQHWVDGIATSALGYYLSPPEDALRNALIVGGIHALLHDQALGS